MGIKRRLQDYRLYRLVREITWTIKKYSTSNPVEKIVNLKPSGPSKGDVLLARANDAFLLKPGEPFPTTHQLFWEAYQQAMVFLDLGYAVDVVHYLNRQFVPQKDYVLFVGTLWNMERLSPLLDKNCVKLAHLVTAHPLFSYTAKLKRYLALQERRGVSLTPQKQSWDTLKAMEFADGATVLGNEFTVSTYRHTRKPLRRVPTAVPHSYPWFHEKDFERCKNHFLFLSGEGMVHKGLDLILEVFASMPQFTLTVCGPVLKEEDFVRAYHRELYETENIKLVGWVDVSSQKFQEIATECVGLLHPSCSEGCSTAVVTCMHAGLIPIVSYESSVDVSPDSGIILRKSSIEEIRDAVRSIASLPASRLREMARCTWEIARAEHSPERFVEEYKRVIVEVMQPAGQPFAGPMARARLKDWLTQEHKGNHG